MNVCITGLGVVSALGIGVDNHIKSLSNHQSGISKNTINPYIKKDTLVGEIRSSNSEFKALLGISTQNKIPRSGLIGAIAAKEALGSTSLNQELRCGFINGSTVGGMDLTESFYADFLSSNSLNDAHVVTTHDLGTVTDFIADQCGNPTYINTISTACSSAANSIMLGARMIQAGILDRVLVGGTDALTQFTTNGFGSLMIYDTHICKPFDQQRKGLNLGEGAGYLLLENEQSIRHSKNTVLAHLSGWSNANDAFHQTGTSPNGEGAYLAMIGALNKAKLSPNQIEYINAHGTATENNDNSEGAALLRCFKDSKNWKFSSTKGFTGHTLGAAGGIEAVFGVLSIQQQTLFANLNCNHPIDDMANHMITQTQKDMTIQNVMSNSFGFGGNSTSLIFSKV